MKVEKSKTWWPITITLETRKETMELIDEITIEDYVSTDIKMDLVCKLQEIIEQYEDEFK